MTVQLIAVVALSLGIVGAAMATPSTSLSQPLLRPGSRGPLVASWERRLNQWLEGSVYPATGRLRRQLGGRLTVNGVFGAATEGATIRFQREVHIAATGVVGLETWRQWIGAFVTCCGAGYHDIGIGVEDAYVGWWQFALARWLKERRLGGLVVDCVFGTRTAAATALLQRRVGLRPSARADQATWRALGRFKPGLRFP